MIFIIVEAENNLINSVIPRFTQKFDQNCIKKLHNKVKLDDLQEYKKPPLLELGWFLIYGGRDEKIIKFLCSIEENITVLQAYNNAHKEFLENILLSLEHEYKVINNLEISREEKINYVLTNLNVTSNLAVYIVNRTRANVKEIVKAVETLRHVQYVDKQIVRSLVPKVKQYSVNDLYLYLIGECSKQKFGKSMTSSDAVQIVYDYRYGFEFLNGFLVDKIQTDLKIYKLIETSGLSLSNYKSFRNNKTLNSDKMITAMSEYQLYKVIDRHRRVSSEYLYFLLVSLKRMENNFLGLMSLISLIKLQEEK